MLSWLSRALSFLFAPTGVPFWGYVLVGLYRCGCVIQWGLVCFGCYWAVFKPASQSPGASDGTGLLFVFGGVLILGSILSFMLAMMERWLIGLVFPNFPDWLERVKEDEVLYETD